MKIKVHFILGGISEAGYRHFDLASLCLGSNGFSVVILGVLITVRFKEKGKK